MYVDSRDVVWLSDFVSQAVLSFDPKTEAFTAYPNSATNGDVRQINGRPGEVWFAESGTDRGQHRSEDRQAWPRGECDPRSPRRGGEAG